MNIYIRPKKQRTKLIVCTDNLYEVVFFSRSFFLLVRATTTKSVGYDANNRLVAVQMNFNIFSDVAHSFTLTFYFILPCSPASHYNEIHGFSTVRNVCWACTWLVFSLSTLCFFSFCRSLLRHMKKNENQNHRLNYENWKYSWIMSESVTRFRFHEHSHHFTHSDDNNSRERERETQNKIGFKKEFEKQITFNFCWATYRGQPKMPHICYEFIRPNYETNWFQSIWLLDSFSRVCALHFYIKLQLLLFIG